MNLRLFKKLYTTIETILRIKQVVLVKKKKFAVTALD